MFDFEEDTGVIEYFSNQHNDLSNTILEDENV